MQNSVVLVDLFDRELGLEEKLSAHRQKKLHRAFSIFLTNDKGEMLLQKRAEDKYHSAGLWANACCSHPAAGEDINSAAARRLVDELGIGGPLKDLRELFGFVYYQSFGELSEFEYDHVFLGRYSGPVYPNPEEISELCWVKIEELQNRIMEHPDSFASWFLIAAPRVIKELNG
jgi:isopentenyl-diphosphate delta-isomerase